MLDKLFRSTLIVSAMTLLSRITGLVRDMAFAHFLGSGLQADAFFVAFRIPNFLRRIFGEGAFSQAFVPVFGEYSERRPPGEARAFLDHMAGRLGVILLLLSAAGVAGAPLLVGGLAPGFLADAGKFEVTVDALRLTFPYLFFISLVAMSQGILNTCGRFAVPAVTPVLLNLCLIGAVLWLVPRYDSAAVALAVGVLIAGAVQLMFQLPFLWREGMLPRPRVRREEGVSRVFRLMLPAVFGVSVAQVNLLVNTLLASFLVTGSVSWLYYSDRLMEFPLGVFGMALATVILPSLSRTHAAKAPEIFSGLLDWALRWVCFIVGPATIALVALAGPLLATLFQYGEFTAHDVRMAGQSLVAFSAGLPAFVLVKVLAPGFFARQDTRTPVKVAAASVVVNVALSLALVWSLAHVGLAIAVSAAAWVNAAALFVLLRRDGVYWPGGGWVKFGLRTGAAAIAMGVSVAWLAGPLETWLAAGALERAGRLAAVVGTGTAIYFAAAFVLGVRWRHLAPAGPVSVPEWESRDDDG